MGPFKPFGAVAAAPTGADTAERAETLPPRLCTALWASAGGPGVSGQERKGSLSRAETAGCSRGNEGMRLPHVSHPSPFQWAAAAWGLH